MASGTDTIVQLIIVLVLVTVLVFVVGVYDQLIGSMYSAMFPQGGGTAKVALLFGGLGLVGIFISVLTWWVISPVREDVRQDVQRP